MTIVGTIEAALHQENGLTAGQLIDRVRATKPDITRETFSPTLSRMGSNNLVFRHLGRWYLWPECVKA